jgi:hypothetical protein
MELLNPKQTALQELLLIFPSAFSLFFTYKKLKSGLRLTKSFGK